MGPRTRFRPMPAYSLPLNLAGHRTNFLFNRSKTAYAGLPIDRTETVTHTQTLRPRGRWLIKCLGVVGLFLLAASACTAQATAAAPPANPPQWLLEMTSNPGLMAQF